MKNIDETSIDDGTPGSKKVAEPATPKFVNSMETSSTKEPKERAGIILKGAREGKGLSLEVVHEATKIPLDALRAIEEGYTIRMLSPFYYSGFVKMYATYLNIDTTEVIEDYKQEELPEPIDPRIEDSEIPKWITEVFTRERKQQIVIAAGIILAFMVMFKMVGLFMSKKSQPDAKKDIVKTEAVEKKDVTIKAVKKIMKAAQEPRKKVHQKTPKIIVPNEAPKVITPSVPTPIKSVASVAPVAAVVREITLTVRANQNSWLRVKTDGIVVFQSTLRLGAVETWFADNEIEISGRNINQLEFELNGKMIGTLGRKDRNAKKVVITKSGLSVKQ